VSGTGYRWFVEPQGHGLLREALQKEQGESAPHQRRSVPVTFMPVGAKLVGWDCRGGSQQSFIVSVVITLLCAPHSGLPTG